MHDAAMQWVRDHADPKLKTLDIGGSDINGSPRPLFADYTCIDLHAGFGVDVVADVRTWETRRTFEQLLCLEVLEHTADWRGVIASLPRLCRPKARLIITAAGPGRPEHSATDGGPLQPGEHYRNITPAELRKALSKWRNVEVDRTGTDVRAVATLP